MAKLGFTVGLIILLALPSLVSVTPIATATEEVRWFQESIPVEGEAGGWLLADGSDVRHLAVSSDGTIYACVNGLTDTLYKSTDGGYSWSQTGNVTGTIVDIVTTAEDTSIIYYATKSNVYKSTDAGGSFLPLAANPALAGSDNIEITAIDVARWGDSNIVVAATRDTDAGEYGGAYILKEELPFPQWLDADLDGYDVYSVAFSPGFAYDQQIVAVVTDEADSFVTTKMGNNGWGRTIGNARLDRDNSGASLVVNKSAVIVFPDDYSSELATSSYVQFVAVNAGGNNGDVYVVYGGEAPGNSLAVDLNIGSSYGWDNIDVSSLAVCGNAANAILLAGVANDGQVYHSYDGGSSWARSLKEPTGQSETFVLMAPDFRSQSRAYAATSGTGSALSVTSDGGVSWNQLGLVDTRIDSIIDLAFSPNYSRDNNLFMLTWGGEFSLWRSLDGNAQWQRVFSSTLDGVNSIDFIELSPQYSSGSQVVFLAGSETGGPAIWKSDDNGQSFICRSSPLPVDQWAVVDDTTLFIAGYDGSNGLVYRTDNSCKSYSSGTVVGEQSLSSIALSPGYNQDGTILVGNSNGWIFWSGDNGDSFETLPLDATSPPLTGNVSVAFDPQFSSNNIVYAASDNPDGGIYRFVIGTSTGWEGIDSTLPSGGMVNTLDVSVDGVLYAANFQQVDTEDDKGGMERCLKPTSGATFETVTRGLNDGATLFGLWLCGNQIWSIDTTNIILMTYIDSLTRPAILTWPDDQAPGVGTIVDGAIRDVSLDWEPLDGATSYQWQIDDDDNFSSVPTGFEGNTMATSVGLPVLEPDTTYYWRVRAYKPVLSPWSEKWSFTTSLGGEIAAPGLESPQAGATGVSIRPVFQWSAVAGASGYELILSSKSDFGNHEISRVDEYALPGNAWQSDVSLLYNTTYYWKVRAISLITNSAWSAVGAFTTEPEPAIVVEPPLTIILPTLEIHQVPPDIITVPPPEITVEPPVVTMEPPVVNVEPPVVAMEPPVITVELQMPTQPPPQLLSQTPPSTPDWVFYMMGGMGFVVILLLIVILMLVAKRR